MNRTALLIIDVQKGFADPYWGQRNNVDAESNIALLLAAWRKCDLPIIHVRHCSTNPNSPLRPGQLGNDFQDAVRPLPHEKQFSKTVNSAFIGTGLETYLQGQGISSLLIVGLTTDHCVSTSTRMAANLGFDVTLISDATATHAREGHDGTHYSADEMHNINLASLHGEFCVVRSTAAILQEIA
ncbi:MAG: cysteine hydrolase [Chloroflexi bacterium]|nr:cysteine hydrolase [Chloroflexota bacterium]